MGKNKDRLNQKSIPWADSILDQVNNLPPAGGEDLTNPITLLQAAVAENLRLAKSKYSESKNTGKYAWGKYDSRLPDGYTEVKYIRSNGTQHIDSGIVPNESTRVVMDIQPISVTTHAWAFGARTSSAANRYEVLWQNDMLSWLGAFASSYVQVGKGIIEKTDRLKIDFDGNVCSINGTTVAITNGTVNPGVNLVLLACNTNGTISGNLAADVYPGSIYQNGGKARDYIPCISPNGIVGLYDLVDNEFNAGSGIFEAGPEAKTSLVGYVAADDESAYPDGGMQDGFYYKRIPDSATNAVLYSGENPLTIGENGTTLPEGTLLDAALKIVNGVQAGVPLPNGLTKYAVDTVTYSSNKGISAASPNHSLGEKPRLAIISCDASKIKTGNHMSRAAIIDSGYEYSGDQNVLLNYYNNSQQDIVNEVSYMGGLYSNYIFLSHESKTLYFAAGVEYSIHTFA